MSSTPEQEIAQLRRKIAEAFRAHWKLLAAQGGVLMILGLAAVVLPQIFTLAVALFLGWLFILGGVLRGIFAIRAHRAPGLFWSLLSAILSLALGVLFLFWPVAGVLTLTMFVAAFFVVEGIVKFFAVFKFHRHVRNWGWTVLSAAIDILLAGLIWWGWPGTAAWALGLLVGVNLFFFGLSLVMTALAARTVVP